MSYLKLRRATIFDPPTPLDRFLRSPLDAVVQWLYSILVFLRGAPFQLSKNKPIIRVVCVSDTHTHTPHVPDGDLLIHAGDLTNAGTVKDVQAQLDWLNSLPHRHKVVIAGNHDSYFDPGSRQPVDKESGARLNYYNINYLENQSLQLKFKGPRPRLLNLYGSPDIPQCGGSNFAFQYNRAQAPWKHRVPISTDILITHTPPRYHLDNGLGCAGLLEEIWRVKPRLHVFGHIHAASGREAVFWDPGQAAFERLMARKKKGVIRDFLPGRHWLDALRVAWYGMKGILWQYLMVGSTGANGGLLVNAALVSWQTADVISDEATVVEL